MVLSNKKLKQKLRAESLAASVTAADPNCNSSTNADPNPQNQSLRELLDSAAQKPRLSKREKRRKTLPLKGFESSNTDENKRRNKVKEKGDNKESEENKEVGLVGIGEHGGKSEKKKKKRKRDEIENGASGEDNGGDAIVKEEKESKKKKKKKKKEKKKTKKTGNAEEKIGSQEQGLTETNEDMDSQVDRVIPTKIYVGGIPYHYSEDDIRSYFRSCGTITEVDCKMRSEDGKFSGISFITFESEDAATRALALDRAAMGERFLTIQQYRKAQAKKASDFAPEMMEGYNRIYVGNLAWDITEDDLRELFSDCSITSIRFGMDKETGEFRGYAHVDFKDSVSMAMALKLNQGIVCGRPVKISCAVPKKGVHTHSRSVPTSGGADNGSSRSVPTSCGADNDSSRSVPASSAADSGSSRLVPPSSGADNGSSSSISGKIRRRTCYECGEKGHLSSACPKKQTTDPTN